MEWVAGLVILAVLGSMPALVHYKSTLPDRVLDHRLRRKIMELLRERPMTSKTALRERLKCAPGELDHHTIVLEQCRMIDSIRVGRYRRYFVTGTDAEEARAIGVLRGSKERSLAFKILESPGVVQQDLTSQFDIHRKVIRSYMDRLVAAGLVREEAVGRCHEYYPGKLLARAIEGLGDDDGEERPEPFGARRL